MKLSAHDLSCMRGGRLVFADVSFAVEGGGLLKLTGPNGSGKSSLLRLIAGLNEPGSGSLTLTGGDAELSIGQQAHLVAHQDAVKPALSVSENLAFWGSILGKADVGKALAAFALERLRDTPGAMLSAGQKRRVSLTRLALAERPIWLLDEPHASLDADSQARLNDLISKHLASGGMAIVATHVPLALAKATELDLGQLRRAA
jgi:heme exporter protein A